MTSRPFINPALLSRPLRLAGAATLSVLALASSAAGASQAEQINRADGVAGAAPLEYSAIGSKVATDDGSTVYFVLEAAAGAWSKAPGLYRRDVATNRTSLVAAGGAARIVSLSADGNLLGFVTPTGLVGSDTNRTPDLYGYNATTRQYNLLSRYDGANAGPIGVNSGAYITRDGKSALFGTKIGVGRRELATGRTAKIGDGSLGGYEGTHDGRGDLRASADGKVYFVDTKLVTPRGAETLSGGTGGSEQIVPFVSPSGRWAFWTVYDYAAPNDVKVTHTLLDTSTGKRTPIDLASFGAGAKFQGFTASDTALIARQGVTTWDVLEVSLAGAATKTVATYPKDLQWSAPTTTGKFAIASFADGVFLVSADGVAIPGGQDAPSPAVYLGAQLGCRATTWPFNVGARPTTIDVVHQSVAFPAPKVASITVHATNGAGAVVLNTTSTGPNSVGYTLPIGGPFRLTGTVKLADGRTTTEAWTLAAPSQGCSFPGLY